MSALSLVKPSKLDAIGFDIREMVLAAEHHANMATEAALKVGGLLRDAKVLVVHGEWEAWITTNTSISVRTAQAYMRLSTRLAELPEQEAQRVAGLAVRQAIKAVTHTEAPAMQSPSWHECKRDRREVLAEKFSAAMRGATSTHRAIRLGCLKRGDIDKARKQLQAAIEVLNEIEGGAA